MSISKPGPMLAVVLAFTGAAPAFAGPNGWEWMNMMERLRQQRLSMPSDVRAQATTRDLSARKPVLVRLIKRTRGR